jgi:glycosyltransferase involved in cell wall biosynthesis
MDVYGLSSIWSGVTKEFNKYDLVFTVFGPAYFVFTRTKHIFGFAQPWIIYPNNPISNELSYLKRIKQRFKYFVQSLFFSRADSLIVELEHVKKGLEKYSYLKNIPTQIVNSTVDSIFSFPEKWQPIKFPKTTVKIKLGVIARNYPHKNLKCFLELKHQLLNRYNLDVELYVTFSEDEWLSCSDEYKNEINNVGLLRLDQCPSFYDQIDGVVFPSLLECFSATPLEAMVMKKPLFSSDLSFIRDFSKECAH